MGARSSVLVGVLVATGCGASLTSEGESGVSTVAEPAEGSPNGDEPRAPRALDVAAPLTLAYADDRYQTLDLYLPDPRPETAVPVLMLAHGGLWQAGDKRSLAGLCEALVLDSRGALACASVEYRLSQTLGGACEGEGHDSYLDQAEDLARAYALVSGLAASKGLDATRIYVGGHSAGAQLGQILNLRWSAFARVCADQGGCPAPAGAIGVEGIYDIPAWDRFDGEVWAGQFRCATRDAFGGPPGSATPCIDDALGVPCWDAGSPSWLVEHGAEHGLLGPVGASLIVQSPDDDWVELAGAQRFAAGLAATWPELEVISVTDGRCGTGSHEGVLARPELARCIIDWVLAVP